MSVVDIPIIQTQKLKHNSFNMKKIILANSSTADIKRCFGFPLNIDMLKKHFEIELQNDKKPHTSQTLSILDNEKEPYQPLLQEKKIP